MSTTHDSGPALSLGLGEEAARWLADAVERIGADAEALASLFPAAGRACGRDPVAAMPGWTVDQAVRVELMRALPLTGAALGETLFDLYTRGDAAERLAVLKGLPALDEDGRLADAGLPVVRDALRTNDARLVRAALGPYGARHLPDHSYRQAILKCVFIGVPLGEVSGLDTRADEELARMMADFAEERLRAGRQVPADIWPVVETYPSLLTKVRALLAEGDPHAAAGSDAPRDPA
ncbi:EboA domain-containing protein [Sphaerisporangium sp. NPDC051011]|uniref:EboA domain-containing protein n=1 Tax=Sphaerisporangium sp. NPDC051011 TaxID=3155792 RepID=UPI0033F670F1